MDSKRVAELLKSLEEAEAAVRTAQDDVARAQAVLDKHLREIDQLKRNLAQELADVLPRTTTPRKSGPASGSTRRRIGGAQDTLLALFADGQPHGSAEAKAALEKAGLPSKNVLITLSVMQRNGKLQRVDRGLYRSA